MEFKVISTTSDVKPLFGALILTATNFLIISLPGQLYFDQCINYFCLQNLSIKSISGRENISQVSWKQKEMTGHSQGGVRDIYVTYRPP